MATCYRHSNRETGVSCSNCGNPICPDCMTTTPVGMRCPDCSAQKTKVHTISSIEGQPTATYVLIALNVLIWFGTVSSTGNLERYGLFGPAVAEGEWYRLLTSGFMHSQDRIFHLLFNSIGLYYLGTMLEPMLRTPRFVALYLASLLGGSMVVMIAQPLALTFGASGAVFGLFGAAFVMQRNRGIDPMRSGIGIILIFNLVYGFLPGVNVSIAGHLGGLIVGAATAWLMDAAAARRRGVALPIGIAVAITVACVAVSLAVAGSTEGFLS